MTGVLCACFAVLIWLIGETSLDSSYSIPNIWYSYGIDVCDSSLTCSVNHLYSSSLESNIRPSRCEPSLHWVIKVVYSSPSNNPGTWKVGKFCTDIRASIYLFPLYRNNTCFFFYFPSTILEVTNLTQRNEGVQVQNRHKNVTSSLGCFESSLGHNFLKMFSTYFPIG